MGPLKVVLLGLTVGQPQVGQVLAEVVLQVHNVSNTLGPGSSATESPDPPDETHAGVLGLGDTKEIITASS